MKSGEKLMDHKKVKDQINELIKTGKIKSEKDFDHIPIDEIKPKYGICVKDLICYRCYKDNDNTCRYCGHENNELPPEAAKEIEEHIKNIKEKYKC